MIKRVQASTSVKRISEEALRLGDFIRTSRKLKGIRMEELASSLDVSTNTIHLIEKGKIRPCFDLFMGIVKALDINTVDLWRFVEKKKQSPENGTPNSHVSGLLPVTNIYKARELLMGIGISENLSTEEALIEIANKIDFERHELKQ